jgi:hypothetical protein
VEWPCNVGKKSISDGLSVGNTFLLRVHVRLQGRTERSVGRHTSSFTQILNRSLKSVGVWLLNIIALCNTAASEARAGKRPKGVYIRRDYVYVSFGQVLLAQFFARAKGAAL